MPALPTDIARLSRPARIVTREDGAIKANFPSARDAVNNPDKGFFETASDALLALNAKAALIGNFRQRLTIPASQELWIDPAAGIPSHTVIDTETGINRAFMVTRLELDMEEEITTLEVLG